MIYCIYEQNFCLAFFFWFSAGRDQQDWDSFTDPSVLFSSVPPNRGPSQKTPKSQRYWTRFMACGMSWMTLWNWKKVSPQKKWISVRVSEHTECSLKISTRMHEKHTLSFHRHIHTTQVVCWMRMQTALKSIRTRVAFRTAGGSLLAITLLLSCSSDEACANTHQSQQGTCADAHSWAHMDSQAQWEVVGDKGAALVRTLWGTSCRNSIDHFFSQKQIVKHISLKGTVVILQQWARDSSFIASSNCTTRTCIMINDGLSSGRCFCILFQIFFAW